MKIVGTILLILGLIGLIVFGIQAINQSEAFSFLGIEVGVSSANWTPVILGGIVTLVGIILLAVRKK